MLDFRELGQNGRGLEQLVREVLLQHGFDPQWSGEGPDGDRDLTFVESGLALLGSKPRRWLVSCKDNSESGKAVGADNANGVLEQITHHGAQGFLLVCATHPSASLVTRLERLEVAYKGSLAIHYWDGVILERLLATPRGWAIAQQFMPRSAQGWKIFARESPNMWVAAHRGYYFHLSSRTGGGMEYDLASLDRRIDEIELVAERFGLGIRLRAIWHNDTKGHGYVWYLDCIAKLGDFPPTEGDLLTALRDGVSREDFQPHHFELNIFNQSVSDHYDRDHYTFYARLPSYV